MDDIKYLDSSFGVKAFLKANTTINLNKAQYFADPNVEGVWKVLTPCDQNYQAVLVYLAGYKTPLGDIREINDFECEIDRIDEEIEDTENEIEKIDEEICDLLDQINDLKEQIQERNAEADRLKAILAQLNGATK